MKRSSLAALALFAVFASFASAQDQYPRVSIPDAQWVGGVPIGLSSFGQVTYAASMPDPIVVDLRLMHVHNGPPHCPGHYGPKPDLVLTLNTPAYVTAAGADDLIMSVRTPAGADLCIDNSPGGPNPQARFEAPGVYIISVGRVRSEDSDNASLWVSRTRPGPAAGFIERDRTSVRDAWLALLQRVRTTTCAAQFQAVGSEQRANAIDNSGLRQDYLTSPELLERSAEETRFPEPFQAYYACMYRAAAAAKRAQR